jgi:hypothetical protein
MKATDGQDLVSVYELSVAIDKNDAIRVSIQGNSDIRSSLEDEAAQSFGMEGTALEVDILAVGFGSNGDDIRSQFLKDGGCDPVSRSIGTIDNDPKTLQREVIWERVLEKDHISPDGIINAMGFTDGIGCGSKGMKMV